MIYDLAFLGHYTEDTIVSAAGTRLVRGGAFNYGAHVAAAMGLKVAAVTRLARGDWHVVKELRRLGVEVFPTAMPQSTCLRLEYPSSNMGQRVIRVASTAGAFTAEEVQDLQAQAFVVGASMRGEVGLDPIRVLDKKEVLLAADVLVYEPWPEK